MSHVLTQRIRRRPPSAAAAVVADDALEDGAVTLGRIGVTRREAAVYSPLFISVL
jgi:hypothetical protein